MEINFSAKEIKDKISAVRSILGDKERFAYVYTFGCQQNEADSEKIRGILRLLSYTITDTPEKADIVILNTCAVRRLAELKALSMIGNFKEMKRKNPDFILGIAGCMVAEAHMVEKIKKSFHYVSFTLNPGMLHTLPALVYSSLNAEGRKFILEPENKNILEGAPAVRDSQTRAWVSIMHGCNNFCSYCIVPYVRGRERSRKSEDVLSECRDLIKAGYKEITLLGQNVNSYSSDMDFADLLEAILKIEGDFIVRFMTSHPKDTPVKLINLFSQYKNKLAPHFHLPLQSGSDGILKAMNRTYNMEKYKGIVKRLREASPNIALTSDIIVGFPGESDEDFDNTIKALLEINFDMVYSFNYSIREGTPAARMENQVSDEKKTERMTRLLKIQTEISRKINDTLVGKTLRVLVDSLEENSEKRVFKARTDTNKLVHFEAEGNPVGKFVYVKIKKAGAFDLFADYIGENYNE